MRTHFLLFFLSALLLQIFFSQGCGAHLPLKFSETPPFKEMQEQSDPNLRLLKAKALIDESPKQATDILYEACPMPWYAGMHDSVAQLVMNTREIWLDAERTNPLPEDDRKSLGSLENFLSWFLKEWVNNLGDPNIGITIAKDILTIRQQSRPQGQRLSKIMIQGDARYYGYQAWFHQRMENQKEAQKLWDNVTSDIEKTSDDVTWEWIYNSYKLRKNDEIEKARDEMSEASIYISPALRAAVQVPSSVTQNLFEKKDREASLSAKLDKVSASDQGSISIENLELINDTQSWSPEKNAKETPILVIILNLEGNLIYPKILMEIKKTIENANNLSILLLLPGNPITGRASFIQRAYNLPYPAFDISKRRVVDIFAMDMKKKETKLLIFDSNHQLQVQKRVDSMINPHWLNYWTKYVEGSAPETGPSLSVEEKKSPIQPKQNPLNEKLEDSQKKVLHAS